MRIAVFSLLIFIFPIFPTTEFTNRNPGTDTWVTPAGIILPRPRTEETFLRDPTPLTIRIINRGKKMVYLQGIRQLDSEGEVQLYFYHRGSGRGWKPYFDSLPCNLPTCRNLHFPGKGCGEAVPFVIRLGPEGTYNSVKDFQWGGLLYQRSEAIRETRKRRYCYKGWIPSRGRVRVEVEYSKSISRDEARKETIGGRDHTAVEFNLPASRKIYEITVGG